ncbi:Nuclear RNA export factor 1 [Nymphon striatum]|nr:Nuclear RNA export factor 1 [Nymphon striatum]
MFILGSSSSIRTGVSIRLHNAKHPCAIRRRFPEISRLDGQMVTPSIGFEIEKDIKLPSSQGNYFSNNECKALVLNFLEQYYNIFDSADRQPLLQAYSDHCIMSLTATNQRKKLLRQGRLSIVAFLCELPKTQHDRSAFIVDINFVAPQLISFTVSGLFKEFEKEVDVPQRSPIRSFNRTFVVVPQGNGISIINEMFSLNEPSAEQIKVAFKGPAPTPSSSPVPAASSIVNNNIPDMSALTVDPQQQMIVNFAEKSGMNADFSAKCLAENNWDFAKAAHTFLELKKRGVIPPEAFIK